jgi:hypothetical protein
MIWYIGSFISPDAGSRGFIFDTNIPSVHDKFYNRRKAQNYVAQEGNTTALEYKPSEDQNSFIAAFYRAIPHRHRGQWYRMVFSSSYGYGATGMSKALQRQQQAESQYMQSLMYMSMYSNSYYGGGYGGYGYGDYGYGYDPYSSYLGYSMSNSSSESDSKTIVTEIQPFTPLIFEFYIAPIEED